MNFEISLSDFKLLILLKTPDESCSRCARFPSISSWNRKLALLQALFPAPVRYFKAEVSDGPLDRDPPIDPKGQIKFGSVGCGPVYVEKFSWQVDGKEVKDLKSVLEVGDKCIITSELLDLGNSKLWRQVVPILTVRPKEPFVKSKDWATEFQEILQKRKVASVVEYTYFQVWFLSFREKQFNR
jgi:hypothetical protein